MESFRWALPTSIYLQCWKQPLWLLVARRPGFAIRASKKMLNYCHYESPNSNFWIRANWIPISLTKPPGGDVFGLPPQSMSFESGFKQGLKSGDFRAWFQSFRSCIHSLERLMNIWICEYVILLDAGGYLWGIVHKYDVTHGTWWNFIRRGPAEICSEIVAHSMSVSLVNLEIINRFSYSLLAAVKWHSTSKWTEHMFMQMSSMFPMTCHDNFHYFCICSTSFASLYATPGRHSHCKGLPCLQ